jgi:hypothetical protein
VEKDRLKAEQQQAKQQQQQKAKEEKKRTTKPQHRTHKEFEFAFRAKVSD